MNPHFLKQFSSGIAKVYLGVAYNSCRFIWLHKQGVLGLIPTNWQPFMQLSLFQREAS